MKLFLTFILIVFVEIITKAQNIEAHYALKWTRQLPLGDGKVKEFTLDYNGFVFQSGDTTINFLKPLYLQEYPSGKIIIQTTESNNVGVKLDMDTLQRVNLYYTNIKKHFSFENNIKQFFIRNSELWPMRWKLKPEIKIINGWQCKHAITYNGGDTTQILFDIWYSPDISLGYGLLHLKNSPGLVVECNFPMMNISYTLKYFKKDEPIDNTVFWPAVFSNVTFEDKTKPKVDTEKNKKKNEIMGQ